MAAWLLVTTPIPPTPLRPPAVAEATADAVAALTLDLLDGHPGAGVLMKGTLHEQREVAVGLYVVLKRVVEDRCSTTTTPVEGYLRQLGVWAAQSRAKHRWHPSAG